MQTTAPKLPRPDFRHFTRDQLSTPLNPPSSTPPSTSQSSSPHSPNNSNKPTPNPNSNSNSNSNPTSNSPPSNPNDSSRFNPNQTNSNPNTPSTHPSNSSSSNSLNPSSLNNINPNLNGNPTPNTPTNNNDLNSPNTLPNNITGQQTQSPSSDSLPNASKSNSTPNYPNTSPSNSNNASNPVNLSDSNSDHRGDSSYSHRNNNRNNSNNRSRHNNNNHSNHNNDNRKHNNRSNQNNNNYSNNWNQQNNGNHLNYNQNDQRNQFNQNGNTSYHRSDNFNSPNLRNSNNNNFPGNYFNPNNNNNFNTGFNGTFNNNFTNYGNPNNNNNNFGNNENFFMNNNSAINGQHNNNNWGNDTSSHNRQSFSQPQSNYFSPQNQPHPPSSSQDTDFDRQVFNTKSFWEGNIHYEGLVVPVAVHVISPNFLGTVYSQWPNSISVSKRITVDQIPSKTRVDSFHIQLFPGGKLPEYQKLLAACKEECLVIPVLGEYDVIITPPSQNEILYGQPETTYLRAKCMELKFRKQILAGICPPEMKGVVQEKIRGGIYHDFSSFDTTTLRKINSVVIHESSFTQLSQIANFKAILGIDKVKFYCYSNNEVKECFPERTGLIIIDKDVLLHYSNNFMSSIELVYKMMRYFGQPWKLYMPPKFFSELTLSLQKQIGEVVANHLTVIVPHDPRHRDVDDLHRVAHELQMVHKHNFRYFVAVSSRDFKSNSIDCFATYERFSALVEWHQRLNDPTPIPPQNPQPPSTKPENSEVEDLRNQVNSLKRKLRETDQINKTESRHLRIDHIGKYSRDELKDLLRKCGKVQRLFYYSGRAHVTMEQTEQARTVQETYHNKELKGQRMQIAYEHPYRFTPKNGNVKIYNIGQEVSTNDLEVLIKSYGPLSGDITWLPATSNDDTRSVALSFESVGSAKALMEDLHDERVAKSYLMVVYADNYASNNNNSHRNNNKGNNKAFSDANNNNANNNNTSQNDNSTRRYWNASNSNNNNNSSIPSSYNANSNSSWATPYASSTSWSASANNLGYNTNSDSSQTTPSTSNPPPRTYSADAPPNNNNTGNFNNNWTAPSSSASNTNNAQDDSGESSGEDLIDNRNRNTPKFNTPKTNSNSYSTTNPNTPANNSNGNSNTNSNSNISNMSSNASSTMNIQTDGWDI